MAENEFEMIPDEMKEIINTIALADSVKRTIQEKEIDGVEMTKTDKANIIGYLCCDKGPEINRALGYIMMNAIFAWSIGNMTDERLIEELDGFQEQWRKIINNTIKMSKLAFDTIFETGPHIDLTKEED
jgi:hypothetical protein